GPPRPRPSPPEQRAPPDQQPTRKYHHTWTRPGRAPSEDPRAVPREDTLGPAAVRDGEDLHVVAAGVGEVDAASPVPRVDLPGAGPVRVRVVPGAGLLDAGEHGVELLVRHQERAVLGAEVVGVHEVD